MKKKLFLHIGYHRTGTTSLQNFFYSNRYEFLKQGLLYPEIGLSGPTHAMFALSLPGERDKIVKKIASILPQGRNSSYNIYSGPTADELYGSLGKLINDTCCEKIFLSTECFLEWIDPEVVYKILKKYCDCEVKIIVYLKRQDLWIQSVFNQVVKDRYLRYAGSMSELPQIEWLDYYTTLKQWSDKFGKKNLLVRVYKKNYYDRYCTITDVLNLLNIKSIGKYHYPKTLQEKNMSLSVYQNKILHELNCKGAPNNLFEKIVSFFEKKNEKNKSAITSLFLDYREAYSTYIKYYESNIKISNDFFYGQELFTAPTIDEYNRNDSILPDDIAELLIYLNDLSSGFK